MKDYEKLLTLLQRSGFFPEQSEMLLTLQEQSRRDELVISVVGQFKRGKSSLINALLGEALLPVAITPLTAVVTEIRQAQETCAQVYFSSGKECEIPITDLAQYCGEKENPHNKKGVQAVRLRTPDQPFGAGTVLVDTPGVGSVNQDNTRETMKYLIHSDAVIFVLSVDSPINETEQQFLRDIRQYSPNLWIVVNKSDMAGEDDLREFLDYCTAVLTEELGSPPALYPVSARTGDGIDALKKRLQLDLEARCDQLRASSRRQKLQLILGQIRALLSAAEQTASAPQAELEEKRRRLWEKRSSLSSYGETLHLISQHHTEKLVESIGADLRAQTDDLRQDLRRRSKELTQQLHTLPPEGFRRAYQAELEQYLKEQLNTLNERGLAQLHSGYAEITAVLEAHADEAEETLAKTLREEFQVDYPLTREQFSVSAQEDFYVRSDLRQMPKFYGGLKDRLVSRQVFESRFCKQCLSCAEENLDCNVNNMIYNYRYKMQESLRPLQRKLGERIGKVSGELGRLIDLMDTRAQSVKTEQQTESELYREIRAAADELRND